jgi:hypothetical protein
LEKTPKQKLQDKGGDEEKVGTTGKGVSSPPANVSKSTKGTPSPSPSRQQGGSQQEAGGGSDDAFEEPLAMSHKSKRQKLSTPEFNRKPKNTKKDGKKDSKVSAQDPTGGGEGTHGAEAEAPTNLTVGADGLWHSAVDDERVYTCRVEARCGTISDIETRVHEKHASSHPPTHTHTYTHTHTRTHALTHIHTRTHTHTY